MLVIFKRLETRAEKETCAAAVVHEMALRGVVLGREKEDGRTCELQCRARFGLWVPSFGNSARWVRHLLDVRRIK